MYIISLVLIAFGCKRNDGEKIAGRYEIDKVALRDSTVEVTEYPFLQLNNDQTFELQQTNGSKAKQGTWRVVKRLGSSEYLVEFTLPTRTIEAKLDGTIFYFDYPDDFYDGRFSRTLYVQTN